jgi:hypothetical protein
MYSQFGVFEANAWVRPEVGNSFGFAGHIRDKLGIRGPVNVLVN